MWTNKGNAIMSSTGTATFYFKNIIPAGGGGGGGIFSGGGIPGPPTLCMKPCGCISMHEHASNYSMI